MSLRIQTPFKGLCKNPGHDGKGQISDDRQTMQPVHTSDSLALTNGRLRLRAAFAEQREGFLTISR